MNEEGEILELFDRWNDALQSGRPDEVVRLYAPDAVLLPTRSNRVRRTPEGIRDYFECFLSLRPSCRIEESGLRRFPGLAVRSGIYRFRLAAEPSATVRARFTFVYGRGPDGWRILEHHSSAMPEPEA